MESFRRFGECNVPNDLLKECGTKNPTRLEISEYKIYRKCRQGGLNILKPLYLSSEKVDRLKRSPVYYFTGDLGLAYCMQKLDLLRLQSHGYMYHWTFGKTLVLEHGCIPAYKFALGTHHTQMQKSVGELDYLRTRNLMISRKIYNVKEKISSDPSCILAKDPEYKLNKGIKLTYGTGVQCCSGKQLLFLVPSMDDCILIDNQDRETLLNDEEMFEKTHHYGLTYLMKLLKLHSKPNTTNFDKIFTFTWVKDDACLRKKLIRGMERQQGTEYLLTALSGEFYQVNLRTEPAGNQHIHDDAAPSGSFIVETKLIPILQDCSPSSDQSIIECPPCPEVSSNPLHESSSITWNEQFKETKPEASKFVKLRNEAKKSQVVKRAVQKEPSVMNIDHSTFSAHLTYTTAKKNKQLLSILRKQVQEQELVEKTILDQSGILSSLGGWFAGVLFRSETGYTKACRESADLKAAQYGDLKRWLTNCRKELTEILSVQIARWEDDEFHEQAIQLREISRGQPDPALAQTDLEALHNLIKNQNCEIEHRKTKLAAGGQMSVSSAEFSLLRDQQHLTQLRNKRINQIQTHNPSIDELYIETYI